MGGEGSRGRGGIYGETGTSRGVCQKFLIKTLSCDFYIRVAWVHFHAVGKLNVAILFV